MTAAIFFALVLITAAAVVLGIACYRRAKV